LIMTKRTYLKMHFVRNQQGLKKAKMV